jgi:hypothetical protein
VARKTLADQAERGDKYDKESLKEAQHGSSVATDVRLAQRLATRVSPNPLGLAQPKFSQRVEGVRRPCADEILGLDELQRFAKDCLGLALPSLFQSTLAQDAANPGLHAVRSYLDTQVTGLRELGHSLVERARSRFDESDAVVAPALNVGVAGIDSDLDECKGLLARCRQVTAPELGPVQEDG